MKQLNESPVDVDGSEFLESNCIQFEKLYLAFFPWSQKSANNMRAINISPRLLSNDECYGAAAVLSLI